MGFIRFLLAPFQYGVLRFLNAPIKIEKIKTTLVGKYVFDNLKDEHLKAKIVNLAEYRLKEGSTINRSIDELDDKIKYAFYALAMWELNVPHNLDDFKWTFVKNPFLLKTYDEVLWEVASERLEISSGIKVRI